MMSNRIRKPGITGNVSSRRKSRGVTHLNNAVENSNRHPSRMMGNSVLMGDHESGAEMTSPFLPGRVTTKNAGQLGTPVSFDCWGFNLRYQKNVTLANYNLLTAAGVFQFIIGTDSNYLTVPIKLGGLLERSRLQTGNYGESLPGGRQSRGVTHLNNARTSDNRDLFEIVMRSDLMGDHESEAEMSSPFPLGRVTKCEDIPSGVDSDAAQSVAVSPHVGQGDTDELLSLGMGDLPSKAGITGDTSSDCRTPKRQSRGVNQMNYARESDNGQLFLKLMMHSVPCGDAGSEAEMYSPLNYGIDPSVMESVLERLLLSSNKLELLSFRRFGASDPLNDGGLLEQSRLKTGNNGEHLPSGRQSRGATQRCAVENSNRHPKWMMGNSGLTGDRERSAEMTDPPGDTGSNKSDQQHRIVPCPSFISERPGGHDRKSASSDLYPGNFVQRHLIRKDFSMSAV